MKKIIQLILVVLLGVSCSGNDTKPEDKSELILSSDRSAILADGEDSVKLSVVDEMGSDVTALCEFYADGVALAKASFKTQKEGNYAITAHRKDKVSNTIQIKAVKEIEMQMVSDKSTIVADGGDCAVLLLKTNLDEDVTADAKFYANGELLTSGFFTTRDVGTYILTAEYKGEPVTGKVTVAAERELPFVHRLMVEEYTSSACPYCPELAVSLNKIMSRNDKIITVALHTRKGTSPDPLEKMPQTAELKQAFSVTSLPFVMLDRVAKWDENEEAILGAIKPSADIAIALECKIEGEQVRVIAKITGKKVFMGAKYVAMLIEDKMDGSNQQNAPVGYQHNQVLRDMSSVWGENVDVAVGRVVEKESVFPLSPSYKKANCSVVVFVARDSRAVINTQIVKVGQRKGY